MLKLILLLFITFTNGVDYCKICTNRTHTLCKYKEGPSPVCLNYRKLTLTDKLKRYIVDIHNDIRNYVASGREMTGSLGGQPPAADMLLLEWDEELATIAQRWADQCIPTDHSAQHDECKNTERFKLGQNILTAVTTSTQMPDLADLIMRWYKQVASVIPSDIEHFSSIKRGQYVIGQYTQLVWSSTRYIGCGLSIFRNPNTFTKIYNLRLVCNYGPAGNIIGQSVYSTGFPCSKCKSKRCDNFRNNLCQGKKYYASTFGNDNEVIFRDNIHFRKSKGKWRNGQCYCDRIYRSSANSTEIRLFVLLGLLLFGKLYKINVMY